MTKKEFMEKYRIELKYHSKSWKVIGMLFDDGDLAIENYVFKMVTDVQIAEFSDFHKDTIRDWKKSRVFAYEALKAHTVLALIKKEHS